MITLNLTLVALLIIATAFFVAADRRVSCRRYNLHA